MSAVSLDRYWLNPPLHCLVRWFVRLDLPQMERIDADSFPEARRWEWEDFAAFRKDGRNHVYVAEAECGASGSDTIAGYVAFTLRRSHAELVRLAVAPGKRRRQVATQLMDKLKTKLAPGRPVLEAAVPDDLLEAHLFLRSQGLRAESVLRGRPFDRYLFRYAAHPVAG